MIPGYKTNTFWSEDIITGLNCFLRRIELDTKELQTLLKFYEDFTSKFIYASKDNLNALSKEYSIDIASATGSTNNTNTAVTQKKNFNAKLNSILKEDNPFELDFYSNGETSICSTLYLEQTNTLSFLANTILQQVLFKLENYCTHMVETCLFEYKEFQMEINDILMKLYKNYMNQLEITKNYYIQYKELYDHIQTAYVTTSNTKVLENNSENDSDKETDDEKQQTIFVKKTIRKSKEKDSNDGIKYPIELDNQTKIVIRNKEAFVTFLGNIDKHLVKKRKLISLLEKNSEYFSGSALYDSLKKNYSRLDTSLYNLESIGMNLILLGVIKPCNATGLSTSTSGAQPQSSLQQYHFNSNGSYEWGSTFDKIMEEKNKIQDNHPQQNEAPLQNFGSSLNQFIRKVSENWAAAENDNNPEYADNKTAINNEKDLNKNIEKFEQLKEIYFTEHDKLGKNLTDFEMSFSKSMEVYEKLFIKKCQVVTSARNTFNEILLYVSAEITRSLKEKEEKEAMINFNVECEKLYSGIYSYGVLGNFVKPKNGSIPFLKLDAKTGVKQQPIFQAELIGNECPYILTKVLENLEQTSEWDLIIKTWDTMNSSDIFLQGYQLKRELTNIYKNADDQESAIDLFLNRFAASSNNIYNLILLLKLWLLDLPDSLLPIGLYDSLKSNNYDCLNHLSLCNLLAIKRVVLHFNSLDKDGNIGDVLFSSDSNTNNRGNIPLSQFFIFNRSPKDLATTNDIMRNIIFNKDIRESLDKAIKEKSLLSVAKPPVEAQITQRHVKPSIAVQNNDNIDDEFEQKRKITPTIVAEATTTNIRNSLTNALEKLTMSNHNNIDSSTTTTDKSNGDRNISEVESNKTDATDTSVSQRNEEFIPKPFKRLNNQQLPHALPTSLSKSSSMRSIRGNIGNGALSGNNGGNNTSNNVYSMKSNNSTPDLLSRSRSGSSNFNSKRLSGINLLNNSHLKPSPGL
ncbi:uncharacterized protein SCODWIG_00269 [Saccharomycodes ludwigii]|uniref:Rho-GAP domain-containing protein n=1 Tax=Saccharomycodes ludwigii TaxID=36035 RepID=A0A376B1E7_9ASCO|nr:hypothetical protein SCDLUD_004751 [Saccharomycodes ludwigii]KAH3899313.1 hypothetical protein SCDLUD_004751 [Saccharomycodes ludwigii]SSD58508.1 uncharacterized protein SCODWIG_00269 [Saccharomycodes ludwigii]